MDKSLIRSIMKTKRLEVSPETLYLQSEKIIQHVMSHPLYIQAKTIGVYVSLPQEVNTLSLIQKAFETHRVCVPKVQGHQMSFYQITSLEQLKEGHFHVLEPMTSQMILPQEIELMIVPMLAYDSLLYRVGYGKGYYDRYFQQGFQGYKMGLAFSFQQVDQIDVDQYDVKLDEIITEI